MEARGDDFLDAFPGLVLGQAAPSDCLTLVMLLEIHFSERKEETQRGQVARRACTVKQGIKPGSS